MPPKVQSTFKLQPISLNEIEKEIDKLNPKKTTGPYSIPITILKLIKDKVSQPLLHIFNLSFSLGKFPDGFKYAKVTPIFKNGSRLTVSNYRPISLLSVFSQMLEKLMCFRLSKYLNKHEILSNKQFGFREKHFTLHAILSITDQIQNAIESNQYCCGVFLDLSKAFDTLDHNILLNKLSYYGIEGIAMSWFISYLRDRQQFVEIGKIKSSVCPILCGVQQRSVLGLMLFLLYINDFHRSSGTLTFNLLADDSNLFLSNKNSQTLVSSLNEQLSNIYNWLCSNKLSLNVDKFNHVLFRTHQKKITSNVNLNINEISLKQASEIKYLRTLLTKNQTFSLNRGNGQFLDLADILTMGKP